MSIKKFVYIFISVLVVFVLYNFIVWNLYTEKLLGEKVLEIWLEWVIFLN